MKQLIYKIFKANFERYDVCFPKELMTIINNTESISDFDKLHKFLDDKHSSKLTDDAMIINKCIDACKSDLKTLKNISNGSK